MKTKIKKLGLALTVLTLAVMLLVFTTVPAIAQPGMVVWSDDFSTDKGWTGYGGLAEWERGSATASSDCHSCDDPSTDHSPSGDNYVLGNDIGGCYAPSLGSTYYITSPSIDCSSYTGVTFSFYRYAGCEDSQYDHMYIAAYDGSTWNILWGNPASDICDDSWVYQEFDVSAYADGNSDFRVSFGLGTTDSGLESMGWNIDDVEITGTRHWTPGDPNTKWVQMPELTQGASLAIASNTTTPSPVVDNFVCEESGPITDIHVWGSWGENLVWETPTFIVYIAETAVGSMLPGEVVWTRTFTIPGDDCEVSDFGPITREVWWDPNLGVPWNTFYDDFVYQYNFYIDPEEEEAFYQEEGKTYWLSVAADVAMWGWKTAVPSDYHEPDAVYWVWDDPYTDGHWQSLEYPGPNGHPYYPGSIDMAFVITGPP
ncbi:hypothetical protein ACFLU8_05175, partial [Chloroflexota bacterium]